LRLLLTLLPLESGASPLEPWAEPLLFSGA